ncbi:MAG: hypothetical protein J2P27_17310 [Actinobacteria bacterium]|nr:hypothetical protein [Actinomycetota bacterium]
MPPAEPPQSALAAFGVAGTRPVWLRGGQGTCWRAGDVVLKPAHASIAELEWWALVSAGIRCERFRIARQLLTADGSAVVAGWCASQFVAGEQRQHSWMDALAVGEHLHAALRDVPRPGFLDSRDDPWSIGDRVAWDELPARRFGEAPHIPRLLAARRRVAAPSH